jgi:hypothetical protein
MRAFAVSFLLVCFALPSAAGAPLPLTGTWEGSYTCKTETASGKFTRRDSASTMIITQLGPSGPLVVNLFTKGSAAYSGTIAQSDVKPNEGAGAMIYCGTSDATTTSLYNEITTFHYKVAADGSGTIKTTGAFVLNSVEMGTCKGSWRRTSTAAKTVPCP